MRIQNAVLLTVLTCATPSLYGYEQVTHSAMTFHAFARSKLGTDPAALAQFGLEGPNPLGNRQNFYDFRTTGSGYELVPRLSQEFENRMIVRVAQANSAIAGVTQTSIESWLMRGAIREDDNTHESGIPQDAQPPLTAIERPLHHFFDPIDNRGLTVLSVPLGDPNPRWASGMIDPFAADQTPVFNRPNHFSILDAREAMWRALTLSDGLGNSLINGDAAFDEEARQDYWRTTFRALGGMLHLNQDMAQPQHTRNEPHSGKFPQAVAGHSSVYEEYMGARTIADPFYSIDGSSVRAAPIDFVGPSSVVTPRFSNYADFWSSGPGAASLTGSGIADYSNHGFLTAAKNIGNTDYQLPPASAQNPFYTRSEEIGQLTVGSQLLQYKARYLLGEVPDHLRGAPDTGIKLAREALWGAFSGTFSEASYTLDRQNYDDMARLLVPRAVAYSAGLLDYFFRGKLVLAPPAEGMFSLADAASSVPGFHALRVRVTNQSPAGEHMDGGKFVAVVKFHRNNCYTADLSGEYGAPGRSYETCRRVIEEIVRSAPVTASLTVGAGQEMLFTLPSPIPFAATDIKLQVVYRGRLGEEVDAVAVTTLNISEPTPFDIVNMTDYFALGSSFYSVPDQYNSSTLPSQVDPALFDYIDDNNNNVYDSDDINVSRRSLQYSFRASNGAALGSVTLPPSSFARLIMLGGTEPIPFTLVKNSFGYEVPFQVVPVLNQIDATVGNIATPGISRQRLVYRVSPDYLYSPSIIEVPSDMPSLSSPAPKPLQLLFPVVPSGS